jgi:hypothetical protein
VALAVLFAAIVGVDDVLVLQNLFFSTASVMILGLMSDTIAYYQRVANIKQDFSAIFLQVAPALLSWLVFVFSWLHIGGRFVYTINAGPGTPKSLYAILIVEFVLFASFGFNAALASIGLWSRVTSEFVYVGQSLVAKSVLAWILFFGYAFRNGVDLKYGELCLST